MKLIFLFTMVLNIPFAGAESIGTFFTSRSTSPSKSKLSGYFSNLEYNLRQPMPTHENRKLAPVSKEEIKSALLACRKQLDAKWDKGTLYDCIFWQTASERSEELSSAEKSLNANDWETLTSINELANNSWNLLMECSIQNTELARKFYYENKYPCAIPGLAENISAGIKTLHEQLSNFLLTSDVEAFDKLTLSIPKMKANPLLNQALIEFLSTVIRFMEDPWVLQAHIGQKHWIEYHYSNQFEARINHLLSRSFLESQNANINLHDSKYNQAKIYKNSILLANLLLDNSDCHSWGLWPQAGWFMSNAIARQGYSVMTSGSVGTSDLRCWSNQKDYPQALVSKDLITEYRKMASQNGYQTEHGHRCFWNLDGGLVLTGNMNYCVATDPGSTDDIEIEFNPKRRTEREFLQYISGLINNR